MKDIVDTVEMPDQDGKSPGDLWYGLPIIPTLATHIWNGRSWRPLLTEEGYYKAEITALRAENERLRAYALKAFTVVEFCCGEGFVLEHPYYDCDDLLLEGVLLLNVETPEEARDALALPSGTDQ